MGRFALAVQGSALLLACQATPLAVPSESPEKKPSELAPERSTPSVAPVTAETRERGQAPAGIEPERRSWPVRAEVPTSHPEPCVFAGTLQIEGGAVSSDPEFELPVLAFLRLDVARLTLASGRGRAVRIETSWPVVGTFFLDPAALPFELASRADLVKGQIWLPARTRVRADEPRRGSARVERPPATGGRPRSTPAFSRSLSCESLTLAASPAEVDEEPSDGDWRLYEGSVSLSPSPGSAPFGKLELGPSGASFRVVEERGAWTRIVGTPDDALDGYVPYAFDAWTKSTSTEGGYGMGGLWMGPPEPTHVTVSAVPLFGAARGRNPIAMLAPDVTLAAGEVSNGFVQVYVPYVGGVDARPLWIAERDLAANARALGAP